VLELSGNACRDNKRSRISPRDILLAVGLDQELHQFFKRIIIPGGGVVGNINPALITPAAGAGSKSAKPANPPKVARPRPLALPAIPVLARVNIQFYYTSLLF
jgi:hypothetical protein